jgi:hypothetical protein
MTYKIILYTILAFCSIFAVAPQVHLTDSIDIPNYQELSLSSVIPNFKKLDLSGLNNNTKPGDLKNIRKSILLVRTYMDIFAYCYEFTDPDLFSMLRGNFNDLYTKIGNFDDLSKVNATDPEIQKSLDKCLKCKQVYEDNADKYNFLKYLSTVNNGITFRLKSNLSVDFWGNISEVPKEVLNGYQNIGLLSRGQLTNLLNLYKFIISLDKIWDPVYHDLFHDYRKLIRASVFIPNFFPKVYTEDVTSESDILNKAYAKFGDINDIINEYQFYIKHNDDKIAEKKKQEVERMWSDLKGWLNSEDFDGAVNKMLNLIV